MKQETTIDLSSTRFLMLKNKNPKKLKMAQY